MGEITQLNIGYYLLSIDPLLTYLYDADADVIVTPVTIRLLKNILILTLTLTLLLTLACLRMPLIG